jgi:hypothetical protein
MKDRKTPNCDPTLIRCHSLCRWRDENPCEAQGSNAGASIASHLSIRAAHFGMANGNPASPTMKDRKTPNCDPTLIRCHSLCRWRDENPSEAPGSNAGASFASPPNRGAGILPAAFHQPSKQAPRNPPNSSSSEHREPSKSWRGHPASRLPSAKQTSPPKPKSHSPPTAFQLYPNHRFS